MRHHNNDGTEHMVTEDGPAGTELTACGMTVYGSPGIDSPHTAARVADNICENCRAAMDADSERKLYELADEVFKA